MFLFVACWPHSILYHLGGVSLHHYNGWFIVVFTYIKIKYSSVMTYKLKKSKGKKKACVWKYKNKMCVHHLLCFTLWFSWLCSVAPWVFHYGVVTIASRCLLGSFNFRAIEKKWGVRGRVCWGVRVCNLVKRKKGYVWDQRDIDHMSQNDMSFPVSSS